MVKVVKGGMNVLGLIFLLKFVLFLLLLSDCVRFGGAQRSDRSILLVNCGSNSTSNLDGRRWVGDLVPDSNITIGSPPGFPVGGINSELYETARFFTERLNYTFRGGIQGDYFLRLHFYPLSIHNFNVNESIFDVTANGLKLVSKINVPREISHKNSYPGSNSTVVLIKEYLLNLDIGDLVIEFDPEKGSFGFVNAIEVVPVVEQLFVDSVSKVGRNGATPFPLNVNKLGIQTMYRLNVGGSEIKPVKDLDLWRKWDTDSIYMFTADAGSEITNTSNITYDLGVPVAPLAVYETARTMSNAEVLEKRFNMSWKFEVDPGFDYWIRLHFCELVYDRAKQRTFRIYINNRTAADNFDVFVRAGGMNKAYHHDFLDEVSSKIDTLWIQLGPEVGVGGSGTDGLLNGLEVFKLSRNGTLAFVEKYDEISDGRKTSASLILWVGIGAGIAFTVILAFFFTVVLCLCKRRRNVSNDAKSSPGWRPLFLHGAVSGGTVKGKGGSMAVQHAYGSMASTRVGRWFTLAEIKAATNNFDESLVIGVGGFGKVYKGETEEGTLAAIKRANPQSEQGLKEFETEIEMLSKLRHRHLVSMIGFCEEQNEMILVYEYMSNGTLRSHLFGSGLPQLSWKLRLEICIGAARGLHYLHTGAERGIIHRDIKTTNILLDENFIAKMADFGLSKDGPSLEHTHVSTAVKGSFGYLDPEYFRRQQLTEKSDVYSFGVVLFEVVCARAVINPSLPRDQINLAEWAMRWQRQKSLETIIDPWLKGKCSPDSLVKFGEIAEKCLADEGKSRPTMGEVLWHLEDVLQVHEAWTRENPPMEENLEEGQGSAGAATTEPAIEAEGETSSRRSIGSNLAVEFSQLVNPQGR